MPAPTPEQIAKLPRWAQEHVKDLERNLATAQALSKRLADAQTPSPFFVDDWTVTPTVKRYIQSPADRLCVEHAGVHLEIFLARPDDGQRLYGIELSYHGINERSSSGSTIALMPRSISCIQLVNKANLR